MNGTGTITSVGTGVVQQTVSVILGVPLQLTMSGGSAHICQFPESVRFDTAKSFVSAGAENKLALADLLTFVQSQAGGPVRRLVVVGHADSSGVRVDNQKLSERRARAGARRSSRSRRRGAEARCHGS